jgi:PTS system ascorbate-specific IIA component
MVGLLIITHGDIGAAIVESAEEVFGAAPFRYRLMSAGRSADPERAFQTARQNVEQLDEGGGMLILTDVFGATPCNIASRLVTMPNLALATGLNLAMLMKMFNYSDLELAELMEKAVAGGMESAFEVIPGMLPNGD